MNTTTLTELRELLKRLIPLLQEDVATLQQEASGQSPLIRRLLQREIQERESLIHQLQETVTPLSIEQNESWTEERFQEELLSSERYRDHYESQNQTEKLCQFGVDLMNLVERKQWQLNYKFNKYYFNFYFGRRPIFGINLRGSQALYVTLPADILAHHNDGQYTYAYRASSKCGVYPRHVTVADIKDLLEFAYNWRAGLLSLAR